MPLEEYRRKRDFSATSEPAGGGADEHPGSGRFVVQEHHARARHFDFRLEMDGVLVSWAIPKGPSYDPSEKRLAVHVEDHPLDYADFEGTIPAGQYGGGTVIVWDTGTWSPVGDAAEGLKRGDFKFELRGTKLHGRWVLVRLKPRPKDRNENWLLIKERDEFVRPHADYDVITAEPRSAKTGRTVAEVAAGAEDAEDPLEPAPVDTPAAQGVAPAATAASSSAKLPYDADVELATLVKTPPPGPEWISEVKYDGYRMLAAIDGGRPSIWSRNRTEWTERLPAIASALTQLPATTALLDGELVVFDARGISHFQDLQHAIKAAPERLSFAAFDLLHLNGVDLRPLGLLQRKELLKAVLADLPPGSPLHYVEHVEGAAEDFHARACETGLEGTVVKRVGSPYTGRRTRDWLKVKCQHREEFVVGGFTEPKGGREGLGALLVGCHDAAGELRYHGRVGSGLTEDELASLRARLDRIERKTPPFADPPHVPAADAVHWVRPSLVVQVAYAELTGDGALRHPVYLGMREDKIASEVTCEFAEDPPAPDGQPAEEPPAKQPSAPDLEESRPTEVLGVTITNPDKRLFPESTLGKLDLARYYEAVAPLMLPEAGERFLTLVRCPSGEGRGCFYQRHPESARLAHVRHETFVLSSDEQQEWLYVDSAAGIVELAQRGVLEIHTWGSRRDAPERPDRLVFDLDPGPGLPWDRLLEAAHLVAEDLRALDLPTYVKTTGGKGLHIVVPVEPVWDFDRAKPLTKTLVDRLAAGRPDLLVAKMAKSLREGRVYLDYLRNGAGSSAVAPYSARNHPGPSIATPVTWTELDAANALPVFGTAEVLARVGAGTDPWAGMERDAAGARVLKRAEAKLAE